VKVFIIKDLGVIYFWFNILFLIFKASMNVPGNWNGINNKRVALESDNPATGGIG
jgi:hypothetical protein